MSVLMTFGKRQATSFGTKSELSVERRTPARRGGYWLGVVTVPTTFVVLMFGAAIAIGAPIDTTLRDLPLAGLTLAVAAAIVLLTSDFALRALACRSPWIYSLVCGFALFGLCFITPVPPHYLLVMALLPGLAGGFVLGWSRR